MNQSFFRLFPVTIMLLLALGGMAFPATSIIRVDSEVKGPTEVYIRPANTGAYRLAGHEIPCDIPVEPGKNYDVRIKRYANFFVYEQGEQKSIDSDYPAVSVSTSPDWAWDRVLIVIIIPFLLTLEWNRRNKALKARELEKDLEVSKTRAEEAERKAERSSLETPMPEKIGNYVVLARLGEGGMATVFKARDHYGDFYAVKVPHPRIFEDQEFLKRFTHEAKIGQNINHPHIVRLCDFNLNPSRGVPFICMEFVEGESMEDRIKSAVPLPLSQALDYVIQMAGALEYAHGKNIIHRDMKPANVMITAGDQVKVMDFGIAKARDLSTLTRVDSLLGTPSYMAPEQIDSKDVDSRADLYALGVILYECLTLKLPYEDEDPYRLIMKKLTQPPMPPCTYDHTIPLAVEGMIMKLIARKREDRYASATDLLTDLKRL